MDQEVFFRELPKVELHRHLEGSIRPQTYWEEACRLQLELPVKSCPEILPYLCVMPEEERSLKQFLTKFTWLRRILNNSETLARITYESLEDAWKSGTVYAELRFNPTGMFQMGMNEEEIASGISEGMRKAKCDFGILSTTICGIMRDRDLDCAKRTVDFAKKYAGHIVSGIDLFSDESYSAVPFQPLLKDAHEAGLHLTIHAGEAKGAENVKQAIEMGAERIGHGVRIVEDPTVVAMAKERQILLEMCPTSNYQTGAVQSLHQHPFADVLEIGIPACINTDDPGVSNTDLIREYQIAQQTFALSEQTLFESNLRALDYLFDETAVQIVKEQINQFSRKQNYEKESKNEIP